jgi:hypothetical protein
VPCDFISDNQVLFARRGALVLKQLLNWDLSVYTAPPLGLHIYDPDKNMILQ